jgi:RNase H
MPAINQLSYSATHALHLLIIVIGSHRSKFLQKLTNDLLWITNKFQITVQFEWVPGHLEIKSNEIVDQLAKKAAINKNDRLPDSGYISLTHVKVSVRRSCLRDWTKYTIEMHRKKRMGRFYMQYFGVNSTY